MNAYYTYKNILFIVLGVQFSCPSADGYYADPYNDTKFYQCASFHPYHKRCAPPLVWDSKRLLCNWRSAVFG